MREAVYDDLMPDERMRIHADLATILQADVDREPDPGLAALSRVAFHWYAARDLPRTLAASVRAGFAARRVGAAESVTHFEHALAVWDRVPDAAAVAGRPHAELVVLLAEAAMDQGDWERMHSLVREAVDLLRPDTDPLLASRVYAALGECWVFNGDTVDRKEAIRLAVEFAGDQPTEELARALVAQSSFHLYDDHRSVRCLDAATRAAEAAGIAGCTDALGDAMRNRARALADLGRVEEAVEAQKRAVQVARDAGRPGRAIYDVAVLAELCTHAGQIDRGRDIARQGFEEGLGLGLGVHAALCGAGLQEQLRWRGRLDEAEQLLGELRELGIRPYRWRYLRVEMLLARGDAPAVLPLVHEIMSAQSRRGGLPERGRAGRDDRGRVGRTRRGASVPRRLRAVRLPAPLGHRGAGRVSRAVSRRAHLGCHGRRGQGRGSAAPGAGPVRADGRVAGQLRRRPARAR